MLTHPSYRYLTLSYRNWHLLCFIFFTRNMLAQHFERAKKWSKASIYLCKHHQIYQFLLWDLKTEEENSCQTSHSNSMAFRQHVPHFQTMLFIFVIKSVTFGFKFHWCLFLMTHLTVCQHWFRHMVGAAQATTHYLHRFLHRSSTYSFTPSGLKELVDVSGIHPMYNGLPIFNLSLSKVMVTKREQIVQDVISYPYPRYQGPVSISKNTSFRKIS